MNRKIIGIFLLGLMCLGFSAKAQKEVQEFEGGLNVGFCVPVESYRDGTAKLGQVLGIAGRYNIPYSEWSIGLEVQINCMRRDFHLIDNAGNSFKTDNNNRTTTIAAVADYNFKQGCKVNPYVGLGLGIAYNQAITSYYNINTSTNLLISPRIGVELFHHLRIGAGFMVSRKAYNGFFATVGFVIGGRPARAVK